MTIVRLPLLFLESSETERLPSSRIREILRSDGFGPELPIQLHLDDAWKVFNLRYIVYHTHRDFNDPPSTDKNEDGYDDTFRLVVTDWNRPNVEYLLDEGVADALEHKTHKREDGVTTFKAISKKLGRITFTMPLYNTHFWQPVEK